MTDLARRAARGDGQALADFVRHTIADVRKYCVAVADADVADDLVQQTYLKALRSLPQYRGEAPALAWLLGVARHTCIDEIRRRKRRRAIESVGIAVEPRVACDPFEHGALQDLVARLDPERRECFVLTQMLGLSYEETAAAVGCAVGTVRSRVFRARRDLVDALGSDAVRTPPVASG